ncbi:hypothetical protein ACQEVB_26830 [Pseudonocardia sp. CA-107938]|uniref:hypothetical protein n=1 Tax=Pseudonocardia sp. CA-107938 TaxID=3240021 RepID=UPI003D8DA94B
MSWTLLELRSAARRRRVAEPQSSRPEMIVSGLEEDQGGAGLIIDVDAVFPDRTVHRWRLGFPSMLADLRPLPLVDAAHILRANVEEWRDTRNQYPDGIPGMTEERLS